MNSLGWAALIVFQIFSLYISFLGWLKFFDMVKTWRAKSHRFAGPLRVTRLCTAKDQVHDWITINWLEKEEKTEVRACRACGFIPSKNAMVTKKSLPFMDIWYRRKQLITEIKENFVAAEEREIDRLVGAALADLNRDTIDALYQNALTTHERLHAVLDAKLEEFDRQEAANVR